MHLTRKYEIQQPSVTTNIIPLMPKHWFHIKTIKVHLTPNFFYLFSKRMHNLMKIKKKLCEAIKSPQIYGGLKFGFSGSRPRVRRSGTQCCCEVRGGTKFSAFVPMVRQICSSLNFSLQNFLVRKSATEII